MIPTKPNINQDIDVNWLRTTASDISQHKISLKEAASKAQFQINKTIFYQYPINECSLRRAFRYHEIEYSSKTSPIVTPVPREKKDIILKYI